MKKVLMVSLLLAAFLVSTASFAASKKFTELMADPAFAKADPEGRLAFVNSKIESKAFGSSDVSGDITTRLIMDVLVKEKTPTAMVQKYGALRAKFTKLTSTYDLESHLAVQYLATDPEAVKADTPGKIKLIHKLNKANTLSWPGVAGLLHGMLAYHLATSQEYQKKPPLQKMEYLASLDGLSIVSNMTSSIFAKGVGAELMSTTPAAKQAETFKSIDTTTDFFTKGSIKSGYID